MDKSVKIGDINGNLSGNISIQSDSVVQTQTIVDDNNQIQKALSEILQHIEEIQDSNQRNQAEFNAEILREAVKENNVDKGKKVLGILKNSIGTSAALTTIAKFFGLHL
ncbi:hypothetical protein P9D60_20810 [Bacillus spizizenii]|nr:MULTISPECIES: hypothetical protein [Bacillus subtilis group]MEC1599884.1 hypothetical protein [Bacillus spizizenii]MEC1643557.1 hypothetical protein [Bacillus spizizenii]